jgi:hypothetical protein
LVLAFALDRLQDEPGLGVSRPILGRHQLNAYFFNTLRTSPKAVPYQILPIVPMLRQRLAFVIWNNGNLLSTTGYEAGKAKLTAVEC